MIMSGAIHILILLRFRLCIGIIFNRVRPVRMFIFLTGTAFVILFITIIQLYELAVITVAITLVDIVLIVVCVIVTVTMIVNIDVLIV